MQILKKTESINWAIEALDDMPGIGRKSAERILAETGVEMEHFQNESRFSSWAGLVPECKESAGKKMSTRIRKENKHLKATLVECARAAIRNKQSYLYSVINQEKIINRNIRSLEKLGVNVIIQPN